MVMPFEVAGVELPEVLTLKVSVTAEVGATASNSIWTCSPALIPQLLPSSMVMPVVAAVPGPPSPVVPDWKQAGLEEPTRTIPVGADPSAVEGMTLITLSLLAERAAPAVKVSWKSTKVASPALVGDATTPPTAPVGVPMV
jgi:hypothetical protein